MGDWYAHMYIQGPEQWSTSSARIAACCSTFPLRANGTLDAEEERILGSLVEWTSVNGETLYGTRSWRVYSERQRGPNGGKFNENNLNYTFEDIRLTTQDGSIYSFALPWPASDKLLLLEKYVSLADARRQLSNKRYKWPSE